MIYCDHCGQPCEASLRPEWYRTRICLPNMNVTIDLCPACQDALAEWLGRIERYYTISSQDSKNEGTP